MRSFFLLGLRLTMLFPASSFDARVSLIRLPSSGFERVAYPIVCETTINRWSPQAVII